VEDIDCQARTIVLREMKGGGERIDPLGLAADRPRAGEKFVVYCEKVLTMQVEIAYHPRAEIT
jgi:hypothetical protein